ncbi:thiol-disulfide oxidoreductase DCC family protein [Robertmurraya sp. Marseille-Q9965]
MKIIALYDRKCSLCQRTKRTFQKLDWNHKIEWISLQEYEGSQFSAVELRRELHIILPDRNVLKGFDAVRKLLVKSPPTLLVGLFLYVPFMPLIGRPIYRWIAKNRYKLLTKTCTDGSCSIKEKN